MNVGTGRQNIIILFWKQQFHLWEYISGEPDIGIGFSPAPHLQCGQRPPVNNYLNTGYEAKPCDQTEGETYKQPYIFNLLPENEEKYLNGLNLLIYSWKDFFTLTYGN